MKKKELKKLAEEIMRAEAIIENNNSTTAEIYDAKNLILKASRDLTMEDMEFIDSYIITSKEKQKS